MTKKINTKKIDDGNELVNFIKIIIVVSIIFVLFYILTVFINKEVDDKSNNQNSEQKAEIQYYEILIGNIFNQQETNYYVLIEDINDLQIQLYDAYISTYIQKKDSKGFYLAVINNMFNSKYKADESNIVDDINEFKVSGTTLIEISNGKIVNKYETEEDILNLLANITK